MLMFAASLTVSNLTSAIAAVSSSAVLTSVAVSLPPINAVKAVSGWGSDTSPSGCPSFSSPSGSAFSMGSLHSQFSGKAPSAPQMGQSAFIASAVQAVSQVHTGGSSVSLSANAVVGTRQSTMHRASRILNNRFFILFPPFRRSLTA